MITFPNLHLAILCFLTLPIHALTVTTAVDEDDGDASASNGSGTALREAIKYAGAGTTVSFDPSLAGSSLELTLGTIPIMSNLTIDGSALTTAVTIDGPSTGSIFRIDGSSISVTFDTLVLTGGNGTDGGAVDANNFNNLTVRNSTLHGNNAAARGGAIHISAGNLVIENSTISGNEASQGGGINAEVSSLTLSHVTISRNTADTGPGIYSVFSSTFAATNTVNAGNFLNPGGSLNTESPTGSGNFFGGTPNLLELGDFGGPTPTHRPGVPSPLVDQGVAGGSGTDQRGYPRDASPDIGAVEMQDLLWASSNADDGSGSLREAMRAIAPGGVIVIDPALSGHTVPLESQLIPTASCSIDGSGLIDALTLQAPPPAAGSNPATRILFIDDPGQEITLRHLIFTGGFAKNGGAIRNEGSLDMHACLFTGNQAVSGGGAVYSEGALDATNCTFTANQAAYGGAVSSRGFDVGGFVATKLIHCTLNANDASMAGGGIRNVDDNSTVTLRNCLVAGNSSPEGPDLSTDRSGNWASEGANLIGINNGATFFAQGPLVGTAASPLDPRLAPLGDYGGYTPSIRPLPNSPAIDMAQSIGPVINADQRGFPRPKDGDLDGTSTSDLGAVELGTFDLTVSVSPASAGSVDFSGPPSLSGIPEGSDVTLIATPAGGFSFSEWTEGGGSLGTDPTLELSITADLSVTANFLPLPILTIEPTDDGSISPSSPGPFASGESVTLTAAPDFGFILEKWIVNGADAGSANPLELVMDGDKTVDAVFIPTPPVVVTNANDSGNGSLRWAIDNASNGATVIFDPSLDGATIQLSISLLIDQPTKIDASALAVRPRILGFGSDPFSDGGGAVFRMWSNDPLELIHLRLENGYNNHFLGSSAYGGAVAIRSDGDLTLRQCEFVNNYARVGGGAVGQVSTMTGDILIEDCSFNGNLSGSGGAVAAEGGVLQIVRSSFAQNVAEGPGGGAVMIAGNATVSDSTFSGNEATSLVGYGGGLQVNGGLLTITGCTISDNSTEGYGGGLAVLGGGSVSIRHSTISDNEANDTFTGGIRLDPGASCELVNSIIAANQGTDIDGGSGLVTKAGTNLIGNNLTVESSFPADGILVGTSANPVDPRLQPLGDYGGPTLTRLPFADSPAIDSGDNTAVPPGLATDQRGESRILDGDGDSTATVDLGSVEFFYVVTYSLSYSADPPSDGSVGFAGAPDSTAIPDGDEVTLTASSNPGFAFAGWSGDAAGSDNPLAVTMDADKTIIATFLPLLVNNTDDFGPGSLRWCIENSAPGDTITFAPTLEGAEIEIPPPAFGYLINHPLSIDASSLTAAPTIRGNQSDILFRIGTSDPVVFRNLILADGAAGGVFPEDSGAAILCSSVADLTVTDCHFLNHTAVGSGGAIGFADGIMTIERCRFEGNQSLQGGAVGIGSGSVSISDSLFGENIAGSFGGAIASDAGTLTIERSSFRANETDPDGASSVDSGGAIIGNAGSSLKLTNCTLQGNRSDFGGGIYSVFGSVSLDHVTITENTGRMFGGGVRLMGSTCTVRNSILATNSPEEIANSGTVTPVGTNLIGNNFSVESEFPESPLAGTQTNPLDPLLAELADNGGPTPTRLPLIGSPAIDAAGPLGLLLLVDQRGEPRPVDGNYDSLAVPDLGSVELSPAPNFASIYPGIDPNGDENGNLIPNYVEYAAGYDPLPPPPQIPPIPVPFPPVTGRLVPLDGGQRNYLHTLRTGVDDVFVTYEWSTGLKPAGQPGGWQALAPEDHVIIENQISAGLEERTVILDSSFTGSHPQLFLRHVFNTSTP